MSLHALRRGERIKIGAIEFLTLQRLPGNGWQMQNCATGEWCTFSEADLLDRFARNELVFTPTLEGISSLKDRLAEKLTRDLSTQPSELIDLAKTRVTYLKEIDRQQPIAVTQRTIQPLVRSVSDRIGDAKPPGWRTVCRDYRKWVCAGRDIRAIVLRHGDRGNRSSRLPPEVKIISDQVIEDLYMTPERKRVPEVHLEIVRRVGILLRDKLLR